MKQRVAFKKYDRYDIALLGIICVVVILVFLFVSFIEGTLSDTFWMLGLLLLTYLIEAAFYQPLSIEVDEQMLRINRALKTKSIPLSAIREVRLYPNPDDDIVIFGGWGRQGVLGNWGYWNGGSKVGRYFAYYGCAEDCFLVELDNGKKYVLGCSNANLMVDHINSLIQKAGRP